MGADVGGLVVDPGEGEIDRTGVKVRLGVGVSVTCNWRAGEASASVGTNAIAVSLIAVDLVAVAPASVIKFWIKLTQIM